MGIRDFLFGSRRRHPLGELPKQPKASGENEDLKNALMGLLAGMSDDGIDADVFPDGLGEFGFSVDNPIPCRTILGCHSYLASLRNDGVEVMSERIGSFGSSVVDKPVDGYQISSLDGGDLGVLYLSAYQKRNSSIAPKGFTLVG
ncbi:hypothetical protein [Arenimonas caeni]|uniref:hypothetical protein n=1 Tax=Arenimonas caeni TaxID=2058085 RepID=UPI0013B05625|nr:hypothetical protein [Arenimonas caeni]